MLAALGFPTPSDNLPWLLLALVIIRVVCRDESKKFTDKGRVVAVAIVAFYCFYCL